MTATAVPAFLDALEDALSARSGLVGVRVFTAPADPADLGRDSIMLASEVTVTQERAAMGSTDFSETFDVPGVVTCFAPMVKQLDPVTTVNVASKTVRDRACAILGEVTDALADDQTVSGTVLDAAMSEVRVSQGMAPEGQLGRWCSIEFTISAEAHTTP